MTLDQLENEILALPKESQTALLARLLDRLGEDADIDSDMANIWAVEAEERDRQLDGEHRLEIPAEDVFRRVRES
jgi:hypothetical protein